MCLTLDFIWVSDTVLTFQTRDGFSWTSFSIKLRHQPESILTDSIRGTRFRHRRSSFFVGFSRLNIVGSPLWFGIFRSYFIYVILTLCLFTFLIKGNFLITWEVSSKFLKSIYPNKVISVMFYILFQKCLVQLPYTNLFSFSHDITLVFYLDSDGLVTLTREIRWLRISTSNTNRTKTLHTPFLW